MNANPLMIAIALIVGMVIGAVIVYAAQEARTNGSYEQDSAWG